MPPSSLPSNLVVLRASRPLATRAAHAVFASVSAWAALGACAVETSGLGPEALGPAPTVTRADASLQGPPSTTPEPTRDAGIDASAAADAEPDGSLDCDKDGDGHPSLACGGDDCCDDDDRAHPGARSWHKNVSLCGTYDYDCDGKVEQEFGILDCRWAGLSCSGDGFSAIVQCGQDGLFATCSLEGLSCSSSGRSTETQRCH